MFLSTTTYELFNYYHKNKLKKETRCGKGIDGRFIGPTKCFLTFNKGVPNLILVFLIISLIKNKIKTRLGGSEPVKVSEATLACSEAVTFRSCCFRTSSFRS
jgi:hypothetical protein